jgi:hypothetical protein
MASLSNMFENESTASKAYITSKNPTSSTKFAMDPENQLNFKL